MSNKQVDFFIVGAARSGTTTLWQWLKAHPAIFLPEIKEPHFFCFDGKALPYHGKELDPHYRKQLINSEVEYQELFSDSKSPQLNGDASPGYLYFSGTASRIKRHNPDAKIICILRNPCDRAFSQFVFHIQMGFEDVFDFPTAVERENSRISKGWWWGHHYLHAGNYASQWREYCEVFPESQRLLLLYEDLKSNPKGTYEKICNFLNITQSQASDLNLKANGTSELLSVPLSFAIHRFLTHGPATSVNFYRWLPKFIIQPIKQFLLAINKRPKPELTAQFRNRLMDHYRPEVEKLSALTGLSFSQWR